MAIDTRPLSISSAFNAIKAFFSSQENNSKWKDLNTGAEGNFLMRMLANVSSVISSRTIIGRREQFHDTANFMSSNIGLAVNNGYSVYRGRNQRRIVRFTPNKSKVLPPLTAIGTYDTNLFIYTTSDVTFREGIPCEFEVVIGNLQEVNWNANSNALRKFIRFEQNISEDYALYQVNGSDEKKLPTTDIKKDMIYDKYYIYTNPWKSVTIEYLNNAIGAKYRYDSDTQFRLKYIELNNVITKEFTEDMFTDGKVENTLVIENYIGFEDIDDIKVHSPIYRETQNLVRSKADTADVFRKAMPTIRTTDYKALTPSYVAVTYTKKDKSLLQDYEKDILEEELDPMLYFGRPFPNIVNPQREVLTLDITLGLKDKYIEESVVSTDINSLLASYSNNLNQYFEVYDLEKDLNSLSYVNYARVSFHFSNRVPYETKRMGDMITQNGINYKCTEILGRVSSKEPVWNLPKIPYADVEVDTKLDTVDNEIVWRAYKNMDNLTTKKEWLADGLYAMNDFIYTPSVPNYMFKAIDILSYSGSDIPDVTFTEEGQYIEDGSLLLVCITYNAALPDRQSNYQYNLGDCFNIDRKSFEYVGHLGKTSGDAVLVFSENEYSLFTIPKIAQPEIAPGNLFIEQNLEGKLLKDDTIQVTVIEDVDTNYNEIDTTNLTLSSVIDVKVKEYKDEVEPQPQPEPEPAPGDTEEITIEINTVDTDLWEEVGKKAYRTELNTAVDRLNDADELLQGEIEETNDKLDSDVTRLDAKDADLQKQINELKPYVNNPIKSSTPLMSTSSSIQPENITDKDNNEVTEEITEEVSAQSEESISEPSEPTAPVINRALFTATPTTTSSEEIQNFNWKQLEAQLDFQKYVQQWITSEGNDKLRVPIDVINLLNNLGQISNEERALAIQFLNEYSKGDEEQIYLYMDRYKKTRMEAINDLSGLRIPDIHELGEPIFDAYCVKYYDIQKDEQGNETSKTLVYVDHYDYGEQDTPTYIIRRHDANNVCRIERTYYKANNEYVEGSEVIHGDKIESSRDFIATLAQDASYQRYDLGGVIKNLTVLQPTVPLTNYYKDGSKINISIVQTDDGRVRWEEVPNIDKNQAKWNIFNNFEFNLNLK